MTRWMTMGVVLALVACGGDKDEDSGTLITDTAIGGGSIPVDAPVLVNCDAVCRLNSDGGAGYTFFQWTLSCLYEDPQGNDTVQPLADVRIEKNGEMVYVGRATCGQFSDGDRCQAQWGADDIGVSCQNEPESYEFIITLYDVDGNGGEGRTMGRAEG